MNWLVPISAIVAIYSIAISSGQLLDLQAEVSEDGIQINALGDCKKEKLCFKKLKLA